MKTPNIPIENILHKECKEGNLLKVIEVLSNIDEDQVLKLALQSKNNSVLEEVVQYLLVMLSHGIFTDCVLVDRFMSLLCKYKLISTKIENWATLYLNSKRALSYVHEINWKSTSKEEAKEASEFSVRTIKSQIGQAIVDHKGKILWVDSAAAWHWERPINELIGTSFFDLLTEPSKAFCSMKCGENFFKSNEVSKVMSYDIIKSFKSDINPELSAKPKVLTSQFTRIVLMVREEGISAVHIKTRFASKKTCNNFYSTDN